MADQNIKVNINLDLTEFNKNAKAMSDALSKVLGKDIKMFVDDLGKAEAALNGTEQAIKGVGNAATKTSEGLKQSNKQWTNLALVVQDLPFGFRGIQNNLPALAAGFAAVTGPIYLAVSALIAIWTAFGDEITKVIFKTSEAANQNKLISDSFKSVESSVVQASVSVDKMNFMIDQAKQGFVSKDKVVKTYNETLGKTIGEQTSFNGVIDAMKSKGDKYIELVTMMSFANALAAQSAKEAFTALMAEVKAPEEALGSVQKFGKNALSSVEYLINTIRGKTGKLTPISDALYGAVGTVEKGKEVSAANKSVKFLDEFLKNVKTQISKFAKENNFNLFDLGGDGPKPKVSTKALDALKSQAKLYEDDLFTRRHYNLLILAEEERIALKQAEIDKLSSDEKKSIAEDFKNKRLLIEKQTQDGIQEIRNQDVKKQAKFEQEELDKTINAYKSQLDFFDEFYKNKQNLSTGNRLGQKAIYEQQSSDLQYMLENDLISYQDYINRLSVIFKGWTNNNKALAEEAANFVQQIGIGMMNAIGPALDMLLEKGASIGDVLDRALSDLIKKLAKVAIAAAIVVALLAIAGLVDWSEFGKTFVKFTSAGMGINPNLISSSPSSSDNVSDSISDITSASASQNQTLIAQVSGNDLLVLLNRTSRTNNNTF